MAEIFYIQTDKGLSLILGGKQRTVAVDEPHYAEVLEVVKKGGTQDEVNAILERNLARVAEAVAALSERKITDDVTISGGLVLYRGVEVHNTLADRMLKQLDEGFDLVPMARFLENLMQNPSYRAVQSLYSFLEHGQMPITPDGHFLAYKAVRKDFRDIHSGTFDNSIGAKPWMPRNQVDENPDITCSKGLHVCSFEYLPYFAHDDGHVVICKINPRDVVSIPRDYNNTKMRLCAYEVVGEYEGYYSEHRRDVLSQVTVATEEEPFLVVITGNDPKTLRFARLADAAVAAEEAVELSSTERVEVVNGITDVTLESKDNDDFEGYEEELEDDEENFEDEEEEEEPSETFEIVYADHPDDFENGGGVVHTSGIESLEHAKVSALKVLSTVIGNAVQVRSENDGEVYLTLTD